MTSHWPGGCRSVHRTTSLEGGGADSDQWHTVTQMVQHIHSIPTAYKSEICTIYLHILREGVHENKMHAFSQIGTLMPGLWTWASVTPSPMSILPMRHEAGDSPERLRGAPAHPALPPISSFPCRVRCHPVRPARHCQPEPAVCPLLPVTASRPCARCLPQRDTAPTP